MSIPQAFYIGIFIGLLGFYVPLVLGLLLVGSMIFYVFGNWDGFWKRFKGPVPFRQPNKKEQEEVQAALASMEGVPLHKYTELMRESHIGVAEYRGASGPIKVYALAVHGNDGMQLFFKESATGKLELSGWMAPKAETK